jgi:hypothetical protein
VFNDSVDFQDLGVSFTVGSAQDLTSVRGWFNTHTGGNVTASLWAVAPSVASSPLFSITTFVGASAAIWVDFGQTAWSIGPGAYALTFAAGVGYDGGMPDGAPLVLAQYWAQDSLYPDWLASYGLGIGARISSVSPIPEPDTTALMMLGLGLLAFKVNKARAMRVGYHQRKRQLV